ncbi:vp1054 [Helicoverpa armigera nucleopolyhedrovirus]|uniref:Vp1054 n=1 Tax=Helicoverpa armigera nucleopolyhedrovirus TaxID=51313 RepID=Q91BX3_9ABAC|nr:vp1054 [Helicoverpa armigera nucleopolyhedrovirus]AAK96297.1 vp1054 [Helicoverpa armigera nucleopolyhedrovirus]
MSSTNTVRLNQCVSVKSIPYRPIRFQKTQCPIHPLRANCRMIEHMCEDEDDDDDDDENGSETRYTDHVTFLESTYQDWCSRPYFTLLLDAQQRNSVKRHKYLNATDMACTVKLKRVADDEKFFTIDQAGERNMHTIRIVIKSLMDYFQNADKYFVLMIDEQHIDLIYTEYRALLLPQRLLCLLKRDWNPQTMSSNFIYFDVPCTTEALESQLIYKSFLLYNTVLTMILKQTNPFNSVGGNKNISILFRNLGKCPNNKERIKCCDLRYGGNPPGHIMCPPREMVKRVFHYAKWARTPNNYRRYFELITKPVVRERYYRMDRTVTTPVNLTSDIALLLLDWYNFIDDFRTYFL